MEGGVTVIQTGELFYLRFSQLYVLWFAIVPSSRGKGEETGNWRGECWEKMGGWAGDGKIDTVQ